MSLKDLFLTKKIKQSEVAKKLCVTNSCVSQWIKGKRLPSMEFLPILSKVLDEPISYLVYTILNYEDKNEYS